MTAVARSSSAPMSARMASTSARSGPPGPGAARKRRPGLGVGPDGGQGLGQLVGDRGGQLAQGRDAGDVGQLPRQRLALALRRPVAGLAALQLRLRLLPLLHQDGQEEQGHPDGEQEELQGEQVRGRRALHQGAQPVGHARDGEGRDQGQGADQAAGAEAHRGPQEQGHRQVERRGRASGSRPRPRVPNATTPTTSSAATSSAASAARRREPARRPREPRLDPQQDGRRQQQAGQGVAEEPRPPGGPVRDAPGHPHRGAQRGPKRHAGDDAGRVDAHLAQAGEARRKGHEAAHQERAHQEHDDVRGIEEQDEPERPAQPQLRRHAEGVGREQVEPPAAGGRQEEDGEDDRLSAGRRGRSGGQGRRPGPRRPGKRWTPGAPGRARGGAARRRGSRPGRAAARR